MASGIAPEDLGKLEVTIDQYQACNPVNDFKDNTIVLTVTIASITVITILVLSCLCACCKYRKLKSQYYERVNLLRAGGTRTSDVGIDNNNNNSSSSGRGGNGGNNR